MNNSFHLYTFLHVSIIFLMIFGAPEITTAQNVGVGTSSPTQRLDVQGNFRTRDKVISDRGIVVGGVSPDTSSAVFTTDVTNKGFYIPRLTTSQKNTLGASLTSSNKGLLVFDTDLNRAEYWDGTAWKAVGDGIGGPPTGAAGGDLTGTYPNPSVANNAITSAKILDGTITNADILDNTINLTTKVNNVLPVANGGSGVNTITGVVLGNGSSPMSGLAATTGNQVLRRNNAHTAYEFAQVNYADIAGTPTSLPPSGAAGGDLTGTYPNPSLTNTGVSAGTYTKVTVDAKGRVTTASGLSTSDIPAGSVTADNGLTVNTGNNVRLGGTLALATDVALAGYNFRFTGSGNIGIGTVTPSHKLHVDGGVRAESGFLANDGTASVPSYRFNSTTGTGMFLGGANALSFTTNATERVRILSGGQVNAANSVSVGASIPYTPNTLFDVVGGASGSETRLATLRSNFSADNTGSFLAFVNSTSASSNVGAEIGALTTVAANGASQMIFRTHGGGGSFGALLERMRLTNQGRLGIGTTTPLQNLDVNGRVNIANGVIQRGGTAITATSDLGLYSRVSGSWIRYVTNAAPHVFYTVEGTDGTGTGTAAMSINTAKSPRVTVDGAVSAWGIVPIGGIIAWVPHITGVGSLPSGWVECNGGTVSDSESPLNGQAIPNLNGSVTSTFGSTSGGRFLRGTTGTTGGTQQDRAPDFQIDQTNVNQGTQIGTVANDGASASFSGWLRNYYLDDSFRWRYSGGEVRPVSYLVRWIMRIK